MEKRMATIYKWKCKDSYDLFYIGSTWDMKHRKTKHKSDCKNNKQQLVFVICNENGGFDNFVFEVLEEFECYTKQEKEMREQYYIDRENPSMNDHRAYGHIKNINYYAEHQEEILLQKKQYRLKNKAIISEKNKQKLPCPKCNMIMNKSSINPHLKKSCPKNK